MRHIPKRLCCCVLTAGLSLAATAWPARGADIQFRIIPLLSPTSADLAYGGPPAGTDSVPAGSALIVEIWGCDLDDSRYGTTGLIAAYLNVFFNPELFTALVAHHSALFPAFLGTEPMVDLVQGSVLNLGGVTPMLDRPQAVEPEWARIAWVEFSSVRVARPTEVCATGSVGSGGIGCYGRSCEDVEVVGSHTLVVPDLSCGAAVMMALIAAGRTRAWHSTSFENRLPGYSLDHCRTA